MTPAVKYECDIQSVFSVLILSGKIAVPGTLAEWPPSQVCSISAISGWGIHISTAISNRHYRQPVLSSYDQCAICRRRLVNRCKHGLTGDCVRTPSWGRLGDCDLRTQETSYDMLTSSNGNISVLLAICAGNSPVTDEFPHIGQWAIAPIMTSL